MIDIAQQMGGGVIDTTGITQVIENMLSFFVLNMYTLCNSFETTKAHIGIYLRAKYELSSFDATLLSKLICHREVKYLKKILQSSTKSVDEWNVIPQREHVEYRKAQVFDEKIQKIDGESKRKKRKVVVKEPEPLADYFPNDFEAYVKSNPRSGRMFIYRHRDY